MFQHMIFLAKDFILLLKNLYWFADTMLGKIRVVSSIAVKGMISRGFLQ